MLMAPLWSALFDMWGPVENAPYFEPNLDNGMQMEGFV
jgi:hypothetical protein